MAAAALTTVAGCSAGHSHDGSDKDGIDQPGVEDTSATPTRHVAEPKAQHKDYTKSTDIAQKELPVTPQDAVTTAKEQGATGKLYQIGTEYDPLNRTWVYDVQTKSKKGGFRAQIDAVTREPIESGPNSTASKKPVSPKSPLPYEKAVKIATGKADGRVISWNLQQKGESAKYQFEIQHAGDVTTVNVDVKSREATTEN